MKRAEEGSAIGIQDLVPAGLIRAA